MPTLPLLRFAIRCCAVLACAPWAAWAAAAAQAPAKPAPPPSLFLEIVAIVLPVAVVLGGLVAVLLYLRKRHGLTARDAPLSVVQILPIGPRERIVVLRTRSGRGLAVGVGGQSLSLIAELDADELKPADIAAVAVAPSAAEATVSTATSSTSAASPGERDP